MYVILFLFISAFAQENTSTRESEEEQAKAFYKTATVFFEEADYEQAIHFFKMAYERSERTPILYNIAVAYEKLGDYEQAVSYYEEYKFSAKDEELLVLERKIENLKKLAKKKKEEQEVVDNLVEQVAAQPQVAVVDPTSNIKKYVPVLSTTGFALTASFLTLRYLSHKKNIESQCDAEGICMESASDFLKKEAKTALWADITWGLTVGGMIYTALCSKKNGEQQNTIQKNTD